MRLFHPHVGTYNTTAVWIWKRPFSFHSPWGQLWHCWDIHIIHLLLWSDQLFYSVMTFILWIHRMYVLWFLSLDSKKCNTCETVLFWTVRVSENLSSWFLYTHTHTPHLTNWNHIVLSMPGHRCCHGHVHRCRHIQRSAGYELQTKGGGVHYSRGHRSPPFPAHVRECRHAQGTPQGKSTSPLSPTFRSLNPPSA